MNCTYNWDHQAPATHYYEMVGGGQLHLCAYCADRFGYPEYLVPVKRPDWRAEYGYLVSTHWGSGEGDLAADLWPIEGEGVEKWLDILGCKESDYLVADAAWEPYRAHYSENEGLVYEVTRVTCLPLV
jgi:hypothetical protein